ncbi:4-hydroxythreonine-4-phosphate dehydrogenase [Methylohalomonas lacus]|uniref:4-hydroxythreonine-4-phosphate dehydrogenase n=1 Tax=Methylohalomonas lacus TaxID=398773 RepID=A0AAE3HM19_9GAMM|nr:4-hydroxythreonine-4-phosphate dehydrogenase PdxA [Methylohalomonas lacus]MCS3904295.1 4-hydroxythreonine-4-phosphate dehydrogenase [Methylohalomonas lacus]
MTEPAQQSRLALTPGEPAGIGPDLVIELAADGRLPDNVVVVADPELLAQRARALGRRVSFSDHNAPPPSADGSICISPVPLQAPAHCGQLDPANAGYVLATLDTASEGCLDGRFTGMVTGPVNKAIINEAGIRFSGHTEYLAQRCHVERTVMLLTDGNLRVALATTHLPLRAVADAIDTDCLETTLRILHDDLQRHFGLAQPRILVLGLNPHAGESGHLGREEIDIIAPVVNRLAAHGWSLHGPVPADTAFTADMRQRYDAVLAMYHDQGLPVLKAGGFGHTVNVTLGLPIIRTSVDHGTALDLAGSGRADSGSLLCAIETAQAMAARARLS